MNDMETKDIIMIGAVLLAPVLAVQVQKFLEKIRERKKRRYNLFYVLMSTRAARISPDHVQALNMIDLEFYGRILFGRRFQNKKDKDIQKKWKEYLDHLNTKFDDNTFASWNQKKVDLFVQLLSTISNRLGYEFDNVDIKNGIYFPIAFDNQESDLLAIRQNLVKILSGEKPLPMNIEQPILSDEEIEFQKKLRNLLIEFLEGKKKIPVEISNK